MYYSPKNKENGFTLVELLIAMTIGLIILAALSSTFLMQRKIYDVQEQIVEMVQTARAAMDMMTREIRMAGYDPTGTMQSSNPTTADFDFVGITRTHNSHGEVLVIYADLNGNESTENPPGPGNPNPNEWIEYQYRTTDKMIRRQTGGDGGFQEFALNIQSFTFDYLKADGTTKVTTSTDTDKIRQIKITIKARTSKPDPDYTDPTYGDHYRRYTLTSVITPRNLDF